MPGFKSKAEWAQDKAAGLRLQAAAERARSIPSANWRGVQQKMRIIDNLNREAHRFDLIAARLGGGDGQGVRYASGR